MFDLCDTRTINYLSSLKKGFYQIIAHTVSAFLFEWFCALYELKLNLIEYGNQKQNLNEKPDHKQPLWGP